MAKCESLGGLALDPFGGGNSHVWKEMGQMGAAYTVLWWGTAHALLQLVATSSMDQNWKAVTFVLGLAFPCLALSVALFTSLNYRFPALYLRGMPASGQQTFIGIASAVGFCITLLGLILGIIAAYTKLPNAKKKPIKPLLATLDKLYEAYGLVYYITASVVGLALYEYFAVKELSLWQHRYLLLILLPFLPVYVALSIYALIPVSILMGLLSVTYIVMAYSPGNAVKRQNSCFLMPCAPQSISESDQSFALLAGLVMLLGTEVAPVYVKKWRQAWKSRRQFEQEVGQRIEMARRTNSGLV